MKSHSNYDFGHEGTSMEFKSSFLVPAKDCKEDQQFVVFKAVCAMMKTLGGIVYIGVNNAGGIVTGTYSGVSGDRAKTGIKNNDDYVRFIRNRLDKYFYDAKYVRGIVRVEETEFEEVVRISVEKANRIVYMHRCGNNERLAFRREGPASNQMDNYMIKQREQELRDERAKYNGSRKNESIHSLLQEAIEKKLKVILHGYSSSNSDSKEDRIVEPIDFICDGRSIWVYEEINEAKDPLRQFRLNRIDYVELLEEGWDHEKYHQKAYVDAFEWSRASEPSIHISITLGPAAKNYLDENCPEANKSLTYIGANLWSLDANVHSLEPVKTFCFRFKDSINVFIPDELKRQLGLLPYEKAESKSSNNTDTTLPPTAIKASHGFRGLFSKIRSFTFNI